ncbi:MAG TPA: JAB domain-containing protein [Candidatus Dormibacteraeota bacterium]|nr:JAB domain-containing protein [Candidatus Dormibacteraeota bacterium]
MAVAQPPARSRRRTGAARAALAAAGLADRSEAELIAHVLGGHEPTPEARRWSSSVAALPVWRRRSLGAAGFVADLGIGAEPALRLAALCELADRWYPDDRPAVGSPRDAALLLDDLRHAPTERIAVLLLDSRHRPMGSEVVALGTINASRLQPRDVLAPALLRGASAIVVGHNHPSGDASPSPADRRVTAALREAALILGVPLLDHLILTRHGQYSFRDAEGWDLEGPDA